MSTVSVGFSELLKQVECFYAKAGRVGRSISTQQGMRKNTLSSQSRSNSKAVTTLKTKQTSRTGWSTMKCLKGKVLCVFRMVVVSRFNVGWWPVVLLVLLLFFTLLLLGFPTAWKSKVCFKPHLMPLALDAPLWQLPEQDEWTDKPLWTSCLFRYLNLKILLSSLFPPATLHGCVLEPCLRLFICLDFSPGFVL